MANNFTGLGVNLQSFIKRTYMNLYYRTTATNLMDVQYMSIAKQAGQVAAVIDVTKQKLVTVNSRDNVDFISNSVLTPKTPTLATYDTVQVNLTDLKLDYQVAISPMMLTANFADNLEGQAKLQEAEVAYKTDAYVYGKLVTTITGAADGSAKYTAGTQYVWAPSTQQEYIDNINDLKALLFNTRIYDDYNLGLDAKEYAKLTSALTSLLKYETRVGVEGVDMGTIATAYGVSIFPIDSTTLLAADGTGNTKGFFASKVGLVGDYFFNAFAEYINYPGLTGYYVFENNITFGASVIRPEAIIRLVATSTSI